MNYYKAVFDLGRPVEVKIPEEKDILQKMQADPQFATPPVAYADFQSALCRIRHWPLHSSFTYSLTALYVAITVL